MSGSHEALAPRILLAAIIPRSSRIHIIPRANSKAKLRNSQHFGAPPEKKSRKYPLQSIKCWG